jgi:ferredoxin
MARVRNIIHIDEEKCNGCGQCVNACAEGAIQLVDGVAKLVSEIYCDGLGACIGDCPTGALWIEERAADDYDVGATREHLKKIGRDPNAAHDPNAEHESEHAAAAKPLACGCPGTASQSFAPAARTGCPGSAARSFTVADQEKTGQSSALGQWPVQLTLVPPNAPYFQGADLLVTADCVPFAYADYHADLLAGKAVVVGCPKLDDAQFYVDRLAAILSASDIRAITVAIMEVPCCGGMARIVERAVEQSGKDIPVEVVTIGVRGERKSPINA